MYYDTQPRHQVARLKMATMLADVERIADVLAADPSIKRCFDAACSLGHFYNKLAERLFEEQGHEDLNKVEFSWYDADQFQGAILWAVCNRFKKAVKAT